MKRTGKTLLLFFLFLLPSFAGALFPLGEENADPRSYLGVREDPGGAYTPDRLLRPEERKQFKIGGPAHFSHREGAVWTLLEVVNDTGKTGTWIVRNPLPGLDKIDAWVFRNGRETAHHLLGDVRPPELRERLARYSVYPLRLEPGERALLLTRHASTGPFHLAPVIQPEREYDRFYAYESMGYGLNFGMMAALSIYNLMVFFSIRKPAFLFYVLTALTMVAYNLHLNGLVYETGWGVSPDYLNAATRSLPFVGIVFNTLFFIYFLEVRRHFPRLRWVLYAFLVFSGILALFFHSAAWVPERLEYAGPLWLIALVWLLFILFLTFLALVRRLPGSGYLFLGPGSYLSFMVLSTLFVSGHVGWSYLAAYAIPIGSTLDMIFLSMALGQQIKSIEKRRQEQERLLAEQSKFAGIGEMLGNVTHQWKQPLGLIGSIHLRMEGELEHRGSIGKEPGRAMLSELGESISFMDRTLEEFREIYGPEKPPVPFRPAEEVEGFLSRHRFSDRIRWELELDETETTGNPHLFQHVLQNLAVNAADILEERKVENPWVRIGLGKEKDGRILLTVEDNGGGIRIQPVEEVFRPFVTRKFSGTGLGLAMVRTIVAGKMKGEIRAENVATPHGRGARFTVSF